MSNVNAAQTDGGGYAGDSQWYEERQWCRQQIAFYRGLENQYRAELDNLENDFAILTEQESVIVMNIVIIILMMKLMILIYVLKNLNVLEIKIN